MFVQTKLDIVSKLSPALRSNDELLSTLTLRLLLNLSFDQLLRNKMVSLGLLPTIIEHLGMTTAYLLLLTDVLGCTFDR